MSLGARATKGGAKTAGKEKHQDKPKTDKPAPKEKVKPQATSEQLRMANMIHRKSEDPSDVRRMVLQLMEMTCRTEEEVCSALHDADHDMEAACNLLLEDAHRIQGEWQTSEKKKKKPAPPPAPLPAPSPLRARGRGGRRGGGRGRGRGRLSRPAPHQGSGNVGGDSFPTTEDWDNEEWSGSLSDTKVFTPSSSAQNADSENTQVNATEDWDAGDTNGPSESHIPTYTYHNTQSHVVNNVVPAAANPEPQENYHAPHHQPRGMSGSLSAAQSQYLSQLTQQTQRPTAAPPNSVYSSNYGVYGSGDISAQRKQRARVPPPSKIPVSAVEMPGGEGGEGGALFLDVQFGALDPDTLQDKQPVPPPAPASPPAPAPAPLDPEPPAPAPVPVYNNSAMLNESLSVVDTTPPSQPVTSENIVTNSTSLEKQLSASMKQLSVSAVSVEASHHTQQYSAHHHPRPKPSVAPPAAAPAPAPASAPAPAPAPAYPPQVPHHPPLLQGNVYATQVNSTNASLTAASAMAATAYPSSVTLTQYQPMMNNYQSSTPATVYGGNALYAAYQHSQHKPHKEPAQYDSSVASSNSLTSTSTTQASTAKVTTTSQSVSGVGAATNAGAATGATGAATAATGYAGALYGAQAYPAYDDQMMRSQLPHHMGGYYEVGYGVGGAREGGFGLGAGERFGRTDAASPQQVPAAALPPGYAYFYQPPPTTYQYGVYPTYGGGSGVGGSAKLGSYAPPQPAYDQDSYKQAGPYTGNASKTGGGAAADLTNAMYAKTHVTLNKVNSYDKAAFHSGTPPPFGAGSHLYLPPQQPPLHHHHHHQMDVRVNSSHNRRQESGASSGRAAAKPAAAKPAYSQSYWAPN